MIHESPAIMDLRPGAHGKHVTGHARDADALALRDAERGGRLRSAANIAVPPNGIRIFI